MAQGIVGIDLIPNAPLIAAFERSGLNYCQLARLMEKDSKSVMRMLGRPYYQYPSKNGQRRVKHGPYKQHLVLRENAELMVRVMDLDPVEYGL